MDTKQNQAFIKSKVNKVEESYRSPLSQDFFPTQISNYFIPMNVTKVEKTLNRLLEDHCRMLYEKCISSVFFGDFNTSHLMHLIVRKEIEQDQYFRGGYYQARVMIEISNKFVSRSGYLEYRLDIEDSDKSLRTMEGTIHMPDDQKTTTERVLDIKNFNYEDIGHMFKKIESQFYQTLVGVVFKSRPAINEESRTEARERGQLGSILSHTHINKPASKSMLQAMGALAIGSRIKEGK